MNARSNRAARGIVLCLVDVAPFLDLNFTFSKTMNIFFSSLQGSRIARAPMTYTRYTTDTRLYVVFSISRKGHVRLAEGSSSESYSSSSVVSRRLFGGEADINQRAMG